MAATQLSIYNAALELCEERALASVTEARKPRYLLDNVWNDGGVNACLEEGDWTFATRTEQLVADPNIQPAWGYVNGFQKPTDWLRTVKMASDPYFQSAFTDYNDEAGYWFAPIATIYVGYVSNNVAYGMNLANWTEAFKKLVAAHFADRIINELTHSENKIAKVAAALKMAVESARGKDGMNEATAFFPRGQLSRARQGMYWSQRSRMGTSWY